MKANIELSLRTREVHQLFKRKIKGDRLFIEAILHKFNIIINRCNKQEPHVLLAYKKIEQQMHELTKQFTTEINKFELILARKKDFDVNKIQFAIQFKPTITVTNQLAVQFLELINVYDKLVAILKLLHLAGFFKADEIYFDNIGRIQQSTNKTLSKILLISTTIKARSSQSNELHFTI